ncbi:MAG TPA: primosomal protein N' [Solirubrobacteraceae bacterium]|jgi:primosomal protein N' (replication factor Y)
MPAIAQVEPLTSTRALRGPFDYRLPEELQRQVGVGSMLLVPFGRREVLGVVVALSESSDIAEEKLLAPLRALALGMPAELVTLAEWIAAEYCSTVARALTLMLAPGTARGAGPLIRLVAGLTTAGRSLADGEPNENQPRLTERQLALLRTLLDGPAVASGLPGGAAALRRLADRGLVELERRAVPRRPTHLPVGVQSAQAPRLTGEQQAVVDELSGVLEQRTSARRLLHGITGSGKTEIYLRLTDETLRQGRGAIVLVPEIALTPQIVGRFIQRFGDTVAVLHSRLSMGERHDEWRRLRAGEARVCVGPRSAVFAPIEKLGLIIVDEEHDASYKHEGDPRYDAREVAQARVQSAGALLLLGSATPRAESYHSLPRMRLARRVDGRPLPRVEVLDMRGANHGLHPRTIAALADVRRAQGKAIVLLNRRGWANFLSCRACGQVWGCPHCDVALVLHRGEGQVACHHCGHREFVPERCECGSAALARHGTGTERVEHDLKAALADDRFEVFRLDADSAGTATPSGGVGALLRDFQAVRSGVLVGTQMVAKGHDFADVQLGVVLDADATLRFPDFRAEERTFALIAQLAGRVGRGGEGHVLIQTIAPRARAITHAADHDSDGFLDGELERRRELRYPPFSHLIRIVVSATAARSARIAAATVHQRLHAPDVTVLGPAPLFRLRGRERQVLVLKVSDRPAAVRLVDKAISTVSRQRSSAGVNFSVDVDPQ